VEEALIKKVIARDAGAIEALYDRFAPKCLGICYRYCGNREDAEDVLHDGFIKIIQNLEKFKIRSDGSFEAWMKRIMVNTALNFLRERAREKNFIDIDPIIDTLVFREEDIFDHDELYLLIGQKKILELVCKLPTGYRMVFNMYVFEQYSHKEIASYLRCTESTSKSQLSKARALLRKKLDHLVKINSEITNEKV